MDRLPSLSIVVPSYNEASNVRQTVLEAHGLLRAAIDTPCEWLLVDDGSTDGTWDEITALSQLVPNVVPSDTPGTWV